MIDKEILDGAKRITAQRRLILDLIRQGEGHLDANELYRRAREKQPRLSLSTVYRTLQLLKRLGVVEEHQFAETHHHYEAKSLPEHHHLLCLGCGKVVEFECPLSQQFRDDIAHANDFAITKVEVSMVGLCAQCREER